MITARRKLPLLDTILATTLAAVTLAIYWPTRNYGIIYFDDPLFIGNEQISNGLNWQSLLWTFTGIVGGNWHPITNLSFLISHAIFGANLGAEHMVSVLFHAANGVMLYLLLRCMTGVPWRSAIIAAIFAWHPLRVESVVWIAERKDVLCGFFMMLTLLAYAKYVSGIRGQGSGDNQIQYGRGNLQVCRGRWYAMALAFFALGLMSKSMLVTLPFVLLLLDVWPLERISWVNLEDGRSLTHSNTAGAPQWAVIKSLGALAWEKWPFFLLTAFFSWLTFWLQKTHAAVVSAERLGLTDRITNAITSYGRYLLKTFWSANLAVIYPYPKEHSIHVIAFLAVLFLVLTSASILLLPRKPYLAVGWFWFLGTAVPIIGLIQVGAQAMADRYTYIPLIGPVVALSWQSLMLLIALQEIPVGCQ